VATGGIEVIVPTIAYTGTEYGDWDVLERNLRVLETRLAEQRVRTTCAVFLGSPPLWAALNGQPMRMLAERFGFCTPCIGCHLYLHLLRVPLARMLKIKKVIAGERESHDGRVKVNQAGAALEAYRLVLAEAGVELMLPIRETAAGAEVERLVGAGWAEGGRQLECVLSGNYADESGETGFDEKAVAAFLAEFLVPAGRRVLKAWERTGPHDYRRLVAESLAMAGMRR